MGKLIYTDPQHGHQVTIVLGPEQPVVSVGRSPQCTIHCNRKSVSRRHAEFHYNQGFYEIVDLNSSNGTYVIVNENRRPVKPRSPLTNEDEVWCGDFILHFYEDIPLHAGGDSPTYDSVEVPNFGAAPAGHPVAHQGYQLPPTPTPAPGYQLPPTPAPGFHQPHQGSGPQSFDQHIVIPGPDTPVDANYGGNSSFGAQPFQSDSEVMEFESFGQAAEPVGIGAVQSFAAIGPLDAPNEDFTPPPFQHVPGDSEAIEAQLYEDSFAQSLQEPSFAEQPFAQTQSEAPDGIIATQAQEIAQLRAQLERYSTNPQPGGSSSEGLDRLLEENRRLEERLHSALQSAGKEQALKVELDELEARHEALIAKHERLAVDAQSADALKAHVQSLELQVEQDNLARQELTQHVDDLCAEIDHLREQADVAQDAEASMRELERSRRLLSEFEQRARVQQQETR